MKFNPFAENKTPSVSMFAKDKKKPIQASVETVEDLEENYGVNEYLGVEMNNETFVFFKQLVDQIGEEDVARLLIRACTKFDDRGLTELDCNYSKITSLPELPGGLKELYCRDNEITSLPELPGGLKELYCSNTKITSLPELPDGLAILDISLTPLADNQAFIDDLEQNHPGLRIGR